jgi:hypothetical protein
MRKYCKHTSHWDSHIMNTSLQVIVVYVKYLFMFQNDYKRHGRSVICSIDYWLLYVNRKFKWYELSGSERRGFLVNVYLFLITKVPLCISSLTLWVRIPLSWGALDTLLRVLSIKRVRSCNWLIEAQSTSNCGVCQVSFYVPKWL